MRVADSVVMSNVVPALMTVWPAPLSVPPCQANAPGVVTVRFAAVENVPPRMASVVLLMVIAAIVATVPAPSTVTLPPLKVVPVSQL
jgi:hypothetical protein